MQTFKAIKILFVLQACVGILVFKPVLSTPLPFKLPKALYSEYGVLAPKCFLNFVGEDRAGRHIDLQKDSCLKVQIKYNQSALKNRFIGYDLESSEPVMRPPSIYYRYIGRLGTGLLTRYVFIVSWSGGGTGFFSDLLSARLKGRVLYLDKIYAGGDRCFGGVHSAMISHGKLKYQLKLTSQGLFDVANALNKVNTYSGLQLQDCAVCCIGTLTMVEDKITSFKFNGELPESPEISNGQKCFNNTMRRFGAEERQQLNQQQLKDLSKKIQNKCPSKL
jgi:hypothetical protein